LEQAEFGIVYRSIHRQTFLVKLFGFIKILPMPPVLNLANLHGCWVQRMKPRQGRI
jgi:hypothetical protein